MSLGPFAALPMLGMALSGEEQSLSQTQTSNEAVQPAPGGVIQSVEQFGKGIKAVGKMASGFAGWADVLRLVTLALGLLLIAAGIFSHPAVREKIVSVGKVAGKVAAVAA
ncbi:MAG TPA: hypothetical protein VN785_12255 [Candidatus Angelobacter sp.]|nr:hypothetical protein [Candidatus Angelobacter sp.]